MNPIVRKASEGRTIGVVGDVYRFLATGAETGGAYALWDALVPTGGGPPPHVHSREVEGFFVLEGEMTFRVGDARHVATAGAHVSVPIGVVHSFKNESSEPARMLILVAPAGIEEMFFEVGSALASGATEAAPPSHEEIERLLAVAPKYGVEIRAEQ
jgi:quercetin dioxygenase-like cupin family protein